MGRILKFNSDKAEEAIARMNEDIAEINNHLANIVEYTIQWYRMLKEKYGKNFMETWKYDLSFASSYGDLQR